LQAEQYNIDEMATLVDEQRAIFNPNQAAAFDTILESVTNIQGHLFFIHATGGCGKTFLCNTIAAKVRRRDQVALCGIIWDCCSFVGWRKNISLTLQDSFFYS